MRFRKRIKILPGVHVNLSTRGVSTTVGPRGANINIGKRGAHMNVGIPGTGISHRQKLLKGPSAPRHLHIHESWVTPAGNPRKSPTYETHIRNEYLRKERLIKGKDPSSVQRRADDQLIKWQAQEQKQRLMQEKADAKQRAEDESVCADLEIKERIEELESILQATLDVDDRIDWDELMDTRPIPIFVWDENPPTRPTAEPEPQPIKPGLFEWLLPFLKTKRLAKDQEILRQYQHANQQRELLWQQAYHQYTQRLEHAKAEHHTRAAQFLSEQQRRNTSIRKFRSAFESGDSKAILEYVAQVYERSDYPDGVDLDYQLAHHPQRRTLVVDLSLPDLEQMPEGCGFKFIKSRQESKLIPFKKGIREELYDSVLKQIVLRTIHEAFESLYLDHITTIVVNGSVTALNPATGHDETTCVISVSANRAQFESLNLERIDVSECIKSLQHALAGPLSRLKPVEPIIAPGTAGSFC